MEHIFCCQCGHETHGLTYKDFELGTVFECPKCKKVWAAVYAHGGPKVWISVKKKDVEFHDLLRRRRIEE